MEEFTRIAVSGTHYEMGLQHGLQVRHLRPLILNVMENCFMKIESSCPGERFESLVQEIVQVLHEIDPSLLEMICGQAEALEVDYDKLLRYNHLSYISDALLLDSDAAKEGCSTWAAVGSATTDGKPLLAKNRDSRHELLPLQIFVTASPAVGFRHVSVSSAGSPGIFSSGMNERGLAIADTYVCSVDIGPGLPDYSLMMHILEEHDTVRSALDYLSSVPRMGRNNLILADATGDLAVVELGHKTSAIIEARNDVIVNTNHFVSPNMKDCFVDCALPPLKGDTFCRYNLLMKELEVARGSIDISFAQRLMASHRGSLSSLCRHPQGEEQSATLSTVIYQPTCRTVSFCHGYPCQGSYVTYTL